MTDLNDISDPRLLIAGMFLAGAAMQALLVGPQCARAQFSQAVITGTASQPTSVASADVDGDGDPDALSASRSGGVFTWYENQMGENGTGEDGFGTEKVITNNADDARSVFAVDVNGDGDADALTAADNEIKWYENQVGESGADSDGFGDQQVIETNVEDPQSVHAADVDEDGDPDVLFAASGFDKIGWYENQIGENGADSDGFGDEQVITTDAENAKFVFAADIDGDEDPDALSASEDDGKIAWYENQVGESGADEDGFGMQQAISTDAEEAQSVHAADVDGDGDADVLSASEDDDKIAWYENQVGESGADPDGFGSQQVISTDADGAQSVHAADVDGDGDPDALSASSFGDKITWYENQVGESGADSDGFGDQQVITPEAVFAESVFTGDIDGDGDADALSTSSGDGKLAWYENQVGESGADGDGFGSQRVINNTVNRPRSVFAVDLDGDTDRDILSASSGDRKIAWYDNQVGESGTDGDGFGEQKIISTDLSGTRSLFAADIDGDGDRDALSASASFGDDKIVWYENQVEESGADADGFGSQQVITTSADIVQSVHAADVDGDGDQDALSASSNDGKIAWYENQVGENGADSDGFGPQQVITTDASEAESVFAADADGDGDADALTAADNEIAWYENQLEESGADSDGFGPKQVITTDAEGASSVFAADLDGDGDADALSASEDDDTIAWYENQVGESGADSDGFGNRQIITNKADFARSVHAADLDGDGDPDPLSASSRDDKVAWYENQLGESGADPDGFGPQQVITTNADDARSVFAADLDGDGDADPLSASSTDGKIAWYRNDLASILARHSVTVGESGEVDFGDTGADINFSGVSGSGEVTVTKFGVGPTDMTGISEGSISNYRFTISAGGDLEFDSDTEVQLDVSTLGGIDDATNVTVYKRPNEGTGTFEALSTSYNSSANELVAQTGTFSEFVLASNTEPLPVEMAGFVAEVDGEAVQLTWQTASETNNAGFEVQRKAAGEDGAEWAEVGFVESKAASGTTEEPQSYRFEDVDLPYEADALTYRLKQVDLNGSTSLTDPVTVERTVKALQLKKTFPNPVRGQATVRFAVPERQEVRLELYDVLGRTVRTVSEGEVQGREELQVDLSSLASGTYFLRLRAEGETQTQRLTIVR